MSTPLASACESNRTADPLEPSCRKLPPSDSVGHLRRPHELLARITPCTERLEPRLVRLRTRTQRTALLNLRVVAAGMLLAVLPLVASAAMHKCKSPDGRIAYSDQPCTAAETRGVIKQAAPPAAVPAVPPTARPSEPSSKQARPTPTPSLEEQGRQFDAVVRRHEAELDQRCRQGNSAACVEQACASFAGMRGPAEHFIACAKSKGLIRGTYWTMLDENPRHDAPEADRHLVSAALTPRLSLGKHPQRLRILCFRHPGPDGHRQASVAFIEENLYVERGPAGPRFRRTFSPENLVKDRIVPPVMPEFKTVSEVADHVCQR
jgi:hypothetical protein